ncbi:MAG: hypothetical protein R6W90_17865 [Ignavibacteriaceae bacterium]
MKSFKCVILLLSLVFISESFALPRFSLRTQSNCIDCHVNPTGGGMRNSRGWNVGKNTLPIRTTDKDFEMSNKLNENISLGLDFRGNFLMMMDSGSTKSDFQRMAGTIYTDLQLSDEIDIYARYDFVWQIWEAYGVAKILPNGGYIKGGSFTPNFGIRLDDHTAYTRGGDLGIVTETGGMGNRGLIYEPRYIETGVEAGIGITDFAFVTASVGNSRSPRVFISDPTYTASLHIQPDVGETIGLFFGGSFASFKTERLNSSFQAIYPNVNMFGGYAGIGMGNFTLIGEYDIADGYLADDTKTNVIMIEASYPIIQGIEAVARYDMFDPDSDLSDDEHSRLVLGFEIFPYSFIEVRPQFRLQMEEPSVENNSVVVQVHLYY